LEKVKTLPASIDLQVIYMKEEELPKGKEAIE
jgi:hypothetical protein